MPSPIWWWVIYKRTCPQCTECSALFNQKWHDPRASLSLLSQSVPKELIFVSLGEKSPQRRMFLLIRNRWNKQKKNGRSTKRHQNWQVQTLFEQWKKCLQWCISSNGEYFEGDWILNIKNKYTSFYKFQRVLGPPPKVTEYILTVLTTHTHTQWN